MNHQRRACSSVSFAGRAAAAQRDARKRASGTLYHGGVDITSHDGRRDFCAGRLYPDGIFVKRLKPEHVLAKPPAIAIQADVVRELDDAGCRTVRAEFDGGKVLVTSFSEFVKHGIRLDRGFGVQVCVPLSKWHDARAVQASLDLFGESP